MTVATSVKSPITSLVPLSNATLALTTPDQAADHFLKKFKDIEKLIEGSKDTIASIEGRSWYQALFNSDSGDLVKVSRSQNAINDAMLMLIQEVVELNRKGYEFLIEMIHGIDRRMRSGWVDVDGSLQALSSSGKTFAETARGIFLRIAEGVRHADQRMAETEARIVTLDFSLSSMGGQLDEFRLQTEQERAESKAQLAKLDSALSTMDGKLEELRQQQAGRDRDAAAAYAGLQRRLRTLAVASGVLAVALAWLVVRAL